MAATPDPAQTRIILLDIEGTTTPIDFVYSKLFPYARARLDGFLRQHHKDAEVLADLEALERLRESEPPESPGLPAWRGESEEARLDSAIAYLRWLIDHDRKVTALKSLQGRIWEAGYQSGELRGEVYPDVAPAFARWRRQGREIAIFSSGSVLAQKLLFAHSSAGDLTPFIRNYFDTTSGPKQDPESYQRMASSLGRRTGEFLFLSDVPAELNAARSAGMLTALSARPGNPAADSGVHPVIHSFDEIFP